MPNTTKRSRQHHIAGHDHFSHRKEVQHGNASLDSEPTPSSSSTLEGFGEPRAIWLGEPASGTEPYSKRGKKRKSREMDPEGSLNKGTDRPSRASGSSFVEIDLYPEDEPPPYSTNPGIPAKMSPTLSETGSLQARPPPKTLAKSGTITMGSTICSPSKERTTNAVVSTSKPQICSRVSGHPKSTIADSEEDEDEEDGLMLFEAEESGPVIGRLRAKNETKENTYPITPGYSSDLRPTSSPSKQQNSVNVTPRGGKCEASQRNIPPPRSDKHSSPYQKDSPTKNLVTNTKPELAASQSSASGLNSRQQAEVQSFLGFQQDHIQAFLDKLHRIRRSNAEAIYDYSLRGENCKDVARLLEENSTLFKRIQHVAHLLPLRDEYFLLCRRRKEIKEKMIAAIEEDSMDDYAQDVDTSRKISQRIYHVEEEIYVLLVQALLPISDGSPPFTNTATPGKDGSLTRPSIATVLIQSTQAQSVRYSAEPRHGNIPVSSTVSDTEYLSLTQLHEDVRDTPRKHLKPNKQATDSTGIITDISSMQPIQPILCTNPTNPKSPLRSYNPPRDSMDLVSCVSPSRKMARQCRNPSHVKSAVHDDVNNHGIDGSDFFSKRMGSPPMQLDYEEEYGYDEDDNEMLEVAEQMEIRKTDSMSGHRSGQRAVFAETTGNVNRSQRTKPSSPPTRATLQSIHMNYKWSADVKRAMKERFHLKGFRPNQLEAINATLSGKDAFVLMPTGGGKSLCYQLPSVISSGTTRGVTVVISPLLSLMQDQVDHLQRLNIQALLVNGEIGAEHRRIVMTALRGPDAEKFIQLLYITPEMINKSQAILSAFTDLYQKKRLARIVIDEAHCVSQWGHDFRPDYKLLGEVRKQFQGVPIIALTATATENVKIDVIHNLGMKDCEVFTQSFNRPNLTYEVRSKGKGKEVLESVAQTIKDFYKDQSGIIYCLSRQNCEDVAKKLREEHGIKAHHYHAGMESADRIKIQKRWQAGNYNVIVATIAFGMGIDKADVRFVVHYTAPKSLEGYYQETGRAGRDGKRSGCYLYYGYQDISGLKRMIDDGEGSYEQKERQRQMLRNVVQFCENKCDCRRVQVLNYFNESFQQEDCRGTCDNCNSSSTFESKDFTSYAIAAIGLVKEVERDNVTLLHCVDIFRGGKNKKMIDLNHDNLEGYAAGSDLDRGEVERLFYRLLSEDALAEHNVMNKAGFASQYIHVSDTTISVKPVLFSDIGQLGKTCTDFTRGRRKLKIQVRLSPNGKGKASKMSAQRKITGVAASRKDFPLSTNVSSPVQALSTRRKVIARELDQDISLHGNGYAKDDFVVSDNDGPGAESTDEDDAFEPVRVAGNPQKSRKRQLGPPITTDEKMARLNGTHRIIVEEFMIHAKKRNDEVKFP